MKFIGKQELLTVKYMKIHTWYVMVCYAYSIMKGI